MDEKDRLPSYSATPPHPQFHTKTTFPRRRRALRAFVLACLAFIAIAQWERITWVRSGAPKLSLQKLNQDLETCKRLHHKPRDPVGLGRDKNARFIDGTKATLIRNATIWTGEPAPDGSWSWVHGDVVLEDGLITRVESSVPSASLPSDIDIYDAAGRQVTSGIIDMHSHVGVFSLPALVGNVDFNEMAENISPWARSIDALNPFDPQIEVIKSGGVTTSLVLPGSSNNMGGEAFIIKHATGNETSIEKMLADPDRNWRYLKMACGENPRGPHGSNGERPFSRMGESFLFRRTFQDAAAYVRRQDDWCSKAAAVGLGRMEEYLPQDVAWESLGAMLRGQAHLNVHCYTALDIESMVDHSNEFKFPVRAFHHAHQAYFIPETLKRTWGGRPPSAAIFADTMYYKAESYIASEFAGRHLHDAGITPIYVSDHPATNGQHVVFEAAKGHHYGLPYHIALASVTTAPAEELGMGNRLGKVKAGFDADIVVWDSDPLSVGATPVQVWIDGKAQFDEPFSLEKPSRDPLHDESFIYVVKEPEKVSDALFSGIAKDLMSEDRVTPDGETLNLSISNGKISCIGICEKEFHAAKANGVQVIHLQNGHLTNSFTGVAGTLGLNDIEGEPWTENGDNPTSFSRAIDGLQLDGKKLRVATTYGVTKAISAPKFTAVNTHHGASVGFLTNAVTSSEDGAVFAADVAVHYTLNLNVRGPDMMAPAGGQSPSSYSAVFGHLRAKLLEAAEVDDDVVAKPFSEASYLDRVVHGDMVLALTINSADGISTALRIKQEVEGILEASSPASSSPKIKMAIIGGAESHLVAKQLAAASVGVILMPLQAMAMTWDSRRALTGAPLTNGTVVDRLIDAGVTVGVGLPEDWRLRDLGFEAGAAYHNSMGRLSEKQALDLVSVNIHKILGGADVSAEEANGHFIVSEGSPMEVRSRIRAVGTGRGQMLSFI